MPSNANASSITITAVPLPDQDALFRQSQGWIGADGDYSIALHDNTVLWIYSDTFVGRVDGNRRIDTVMINNSVAIQRTGETSAVEFHYGKTRDGKPASVFVPDEGNGYFWPWDSVLTDRGLFVFLARIEHSDANPEFPFKMVGMDLARVANPFDPPGRWRIEQTRVLHSRFSPEGNIFFGSATLKPTGDEVYIYGVDAGRDDVGICKNAMIVARAPANRVDDFSAWRFYSDGDWGTDFTRCDPLFQPAPTEYSVSYVPGIRQYAAVYTQGGIHGKIMVRLAPRPEGPWGPEVQVFDCPDKDWHEKAFSYAAKAHPELSQNPCELIVTYATNSMSFPDLFDDARLYWPRFIRLTFEASAE